MEANMAGDDASLDAAIAMITKKISAEDVGGTPQRPARETREDRTDRDAIEADDYHDLHDLEAAERAEKHGKEPGSEAKGEEGQEADAGADAFIELPAAEEGKAPERVPLSEAVEAVQKIRQMNGEIDTVVIRAEEEAFQKQDQITQALTKTFSTIEQQAKVALEMMNAYGMREPDPRYYASTEDYYQAKLDYDAYVTHYNKVVATMRQAQEGAKAVSSQTDTEVSRRELARAARFIPEFKDEKSREAKKAEFLEVLNARYGIDKDALDGIEDHRAWRMINDLVGRIRAEKAAPEVRKQVQEKAAKLVQGRLPDRDPGNGRFVSDARKELREKGSEDSFVKFLLSSGALKGL